MEADAQPVDGTGWYRAEALVPGTPDEVLERINATAKYMWLASRSRHDWAVQARLHGLWFSSPGHVDLGASVTLTAGGVGVFVGGRCPKMTRARNALYVQKVCEAFLLNVQRNSQRSRSIYRYWRYGGAFVALFFSIAIEFAWIFLVFGSHHGYSWVPLAVFWAWYYPVYMALMLAQRRYYGIDSRGEWLGLAVITVAIFCVFVALAWAFA